MIGIGVTFEDKLSFESIKDGLYPETIFTVIYCCVSKNILVFRL